MSFQALTWATAKKLDCAPKMVLLMLANRTNQDTGQCNPSLSRLAEDCGMSTKSVQRHIKHLAHIGLIRIEQKKEGRVNLPNQYWLNMATVGSESPHPSPISSQGVGTNDTRGVGSQSPTKQEVLNQEDNQEVKHRGRVSRRQRKSTSGNADEVAELDFSSWPQMASPEVLSDWLILRKQKKAPLTQTVVNRLGKQLLKAASHGHSVDDCLGLCVERGWVGFEAEWIIRGRQPVQGGRIGYMNIDFDKMDYTKGVNPDGTF